MSGALFHGLYGFPLASVFALIINLWLKGHKDDDDVKELIASNPYYAFDFKHRFENDILPKYFGDITIPGADGRQHGLDEVIARGPISVLSGWNIGSRTSFDGVWLREGQTGDTALATAENFALANIPGASAAGAFLDAYDSFNKGQIRRGIEHIMPAAIKGSLTTLRTLMEDGVTARGGDAILNSDKLVPSDYAGMVLGFTPTAVAKAQQERSDWNKAKNRGEKESSALLKQLNQAIHHPKTMDISAAQVMKKIDEFNKKYPEPSPLYISEDKMINSIDAYEAAREISIGGVNLTEKELDYAAPGLVRGQPK
jgi:hypothetical protein